MHLVADYVPKTGGGWAPTGTHSIPIPGEAAVYFHDGQCIAQFEWTDDDMRSLIADLQEELRTHATLRGRRRL